MATPAYKLPGYRYNVPWHDEPISCMTLGHAGKGERIEVMTRGYILDSSPYFVPFMNDITRYFLAPFMQRHQVNPYLASTVINNFVIRLERKRAVVKVNMLSDVRVNFFARNEELKAGMLLQDDDVRTASEIELLNETFEPETGVILLFPSGWRRFLYMDFKPLHEPGATLDAMPKNLAIALNSIMFPEPSEEELDLLFTYNWFPFSAIPHGNWAHFIGRLSNGVPWPVLADEIIAFMTKEKMGKMLADWKQNPSFQAVVDFATSALRDYMAGNYAACVMTLWPQIERLMGSLAGSRKQDEILTHVEKEVLTPLRHLGGYYPEIFRAYLKKRYFKGFDAKAARPEVSRHSIAHGAVAFEDLNQESALLGFLILDQLHQLLWAQEVGKQTDFSEHL